MDCIFCAIVAGEIPAAKVYEDEHVFAVYGYRPCKPRAYPRDTETALSKYL